MKCARTDCYEKFEMDEFELMLDRGFGYCPRGHYTEMPGTTKPDWNCSCGARASNQPGHSDWCPEFHKRIPQ